MESPGFANISQNSESLVSRTSTVNIDDTRFAVDGVIAEMIIEVDESVDSAEHTSSKPIMDSCSELNMNHNFMNQNSPDELSKQLFAHNLGLSSASMDKSDSTTSTASESEMQKLVLECEEKAPVKPRPAKKWPLYYRRTRYTKRKKRSTHSSKEKSYNSKRNTEVVSENTETNVHNPNELIMQPKIVLRKLAVPPIADNLSPLLKLGNIPNICGRVKEAKLDVLSVLFQLMYDEISPDDSDSVRYQVLHFAGFQKMKRNFKSSKVIRILTQCKEAMLRNICWIFGIKYGPKDEMVNNILSFLHEPTMKLDPLIDIAYQPVVVLEQLNSDTVAKICEELKASKTPKRGRKKSAISQKTTPKTIAKSLSAIYKKKQSITNIRNLRNNKTAAKHVPPPKVTKLKMTSGRKSSEPVKPKTEVKKEKVLNKKAKAAQAYSAISQKRKGQAEMSYSKVISKRKQKYPRKVMIEPETVDNKSDDSSKKGKVQTSVGEKRTVPGMKRRTPEKRRKPVHYGEWFNEDSQLVGASKSPVKRSGKPRLEINDNDDIPDKPTAVSEDEAVSEDGYDADICDETRDSGELSDQENMKEKDASASETSPNPAKQGTKAKGVKLGTFPQIVQSINSVTNCVLQRLHVILFGTSLEPEAMKQNILNFDGFSFDKNSEDWEQKHFFLSLCASNNLMEVFEVLHVKAPEDFSSQSVEDLMNFLLCPRKELLEDDKGDKTSPAKKSPIKVKISLKKTLKKKSKDVKEKKTGIGPRNRKVLMSEEDFKKLEQEIQEEIEKRASSENIKSLNPTPRPSAVNTKLVNPVATGATIGIMPRRRNPNEKIKLGDNPHVKFMIVALNYTDLDIIHHVLFLRTAVKTKIRRNILDFTGFNFDETSPRYRVRKTVLERLGCPILKRIAFILGIALLHTTLKEEDLIDRIMHYLLKPSDINQFTVKEFPHNFLRDKPGQFDKKAIFSGIPELQEALKLESYNSYVPGGLVVKSISDLRDNLSSTEKVMSLSDKSIPVANVVSTHSLKSSSNKSDTKEKLQKAIMSATRRNIVPKRKTKVCSANSPIASSSGSESTCRAQTTTTSSQVSLSTVKTASVTNATSPQKSDSVPILISQQKLPPGQAFLIDPSKLLVLSKSTSKSPPSVPPASKVSDTASKEASAKFPFITKLKLPANTTQSDSPTKQVTNIVRPVVSSSVIPKQAVILQQSLSPKTVLLKSPLATTSQKSEQKSNHLISIVRPLQNQAQQQHIVLVPNTSGVRLVSKFQHILPRPSPNIVVSEQQGIAANIPTTRTTAAQNVPGISELPQLIRGEPPSTTDDLNRTAELPNLILSVSQSQKDSLSEYQQQKLNGEGEKVTLLQLKPGQFVIPSLELGKSSLTAGNTMFKPQAEPTLLSLKPSSGSQVLENTTLCESGYKVAMSTGISPKETGHGVQESHGDIVQDQEGPNGDPSDEILFERIRDIIHSANLEDLTLKKINEKLLVEFPLLDLSVRRPFIKTSVKKIICGMT